MGRAMLLIALSIFAPQRTADAAALKMQSNYRPKNFERIDSRSPAHYGLHRFAAGNRLSERFLTGFSAPIAKRAHTFFFCAFPLISRIICFPMQILQPCIPDIFSQQGIPTCRQIPDARNFPKKSASKHFDRLTGISNARRLLFSARLNRCLLYFVPRSRTQNFFSSAKKQYARISRTILVKNQNQSTNTEQQMEFSFNVFNKLAPTGIVMALDQILRAGRPPVVLCIGSDLAIGDSLGPICGTQLEEKKGNGIFVYGTLKRTVTAKEVRYLNDFLRDTHPQSPVIAVDAAVGDAGDIGLIKVTSCGIRPGLGANKRLGKVGDVGIMGIVAEKSVFNYSLLNLTRLNLVYRMASLISDALADYTAKFSAGELAG